MNDESGRKAGRLKEQIAILARKSLTLGEGDDLLVIYDEDFLPFLSALVEETREIGVLPTFLFLPRSLQQDLALTNRPNGELGRLPNGLVAAVADSSVILNVLNGDMATSAVRGAVLNLTRLDYCKFGHIPGLSHDVLALLERSPMDEILKLCDLTAWALGEATELTISTLDSLGQEYVLTMNLRGWDNDPLMSSGIIVSGSWGNIPPGESFVCPSPQAVNGSICVNGSIPDYVFPADEDVVLKFESSVLTEWTSQRSPKGAAFFSKLAQRSHERRDMCWNQFSELGIGLNPCIETLTGNSLFDEKAYRTLHIAIGDNDCFGHSIKSEIHADLVCRRPTIRAKQYELMTAGEINVEKILAARTARQEQSVDLDGHSHVHLLREKGEVRNGLLFRRLHSAGRVGYVSIADEIVSAELAIFWETALNLGANSINQLVDCVEGHLSIAPKKLIQLLVHYRMAFLE